MTRDQVRKYIRLGKEAGLKPSEIIIPLMKKAGLHKAANRLLLEKKSSSPFLGLAGPWGWGLGAALLGGTYLYGAYSGETENAAEMKKKDAVIQKQKQQLNRDVATSQSNLVNKYTGAGALAGGGLGYVLGPQLFPDLSSSSARLAGAATGGVGGAILGSMAKDFTQ